MRHLKFRIARWDKGLIFSMIGYDSTFWASMTSLLPGGFYTASNGLRINYNTVASDISTFATNAITISNKSNISICSFATDTLRDSAYIKIVGAIRELVAYVNNGGTYTHVCSNCINYINSSTQYCKWIDTVTLGWNVAIDTCSHFNVIYSEEEYYEFWDI